ncbi:hypothetical protein HGG75_27135 [Ochrobactrum pseudogrignonense]|nr:hypothetical protein [Brucella pseudogrignonensis]
MIVALGIRHLPLLVTLFMIETAVMAAGFVAIYARLMGLVSPSQPGSTSRYFKAQAPLPPPCSVQAEASRPSSRLRSKLCHVGCAFNADATLLIILERRLTKGTAA